jgi:hypothetical protein
VKSHSTTERISYNEPLMPTNHILSFPACLSHPRSVLLHCHTIHWLLYLPFQDFNNRLDQEFSELCRCYWTSSRRYHFLNTLSHLERVSHMHDNLLLHTHSSTHGKGDGNNIKWTWGNGIDRKIRRKPASTTIMREPHQKNWAWLW